MNLLRGKVAPDEILTIVVGSLGDGLNINIFQLHSLKTRVTILTLVVFVLSIWSLAFYASRMLREDMQHLLGQQQFSTVSIVAAQVNTELADHLTALEGYANGRIGKTILGNAAAIQTRLEESPTIQGLFNGGVYVTDVNGTAIASVPVSVGRVGVNYIERDHVAAALREGRATVGRPFMGKTLRAPIVAMAAPLKDSQGNIVGSLVGVTDLSKPNFLDILTKSHYGHTGGYVLVAAQQRLIITATDKSRIMQPLPPAGLIQQTDRFVQGFEGFAVYTNSRGQEVLESSKRIDKVQWYVGVRMPAEEAFSPIHDMRKRIVLATMLCTLLAGVLTWLLMRRELSEVSTVVKALARRSDSDLPPEPLPVTRRDEIGQLVGGFNRLLVTLLQRQEELELMARRSQDLLELPRAADTLDEQAFMQHALGVAEKLTGSQIAFVHFVHEDQQTIELFTWSEATLASYCEAAYDKHYPINQAGIWADALRKSAPVLINDYTNAPGKNGLPEGHARLQRFISVPVIEGGLVRMMMGVGNKSNDYSQTDVDSARLIAEAVWRIASKRRADNATQRSKDSLKEAQHIAGVGSYVLDFSSGLWESSDELDNLFGIDAGYERTIQGWETLIHPDDRQMMDDYFRDQVVGHHVSFNKEYRIVRSIDQTHRWVHGLGRLGFDANGVLKEMVGTIQDITARKAAQAQINSLAFSDPLTALPNRRFLMDRIEKAIANSLRRHTQGALLMVDLDNFKTLNDTMGHHLGDEMLQEVASRLIRCVREVDTVARLGGDEFVVLLEDLSETAGEAATQAKIVGDKILAALRQPYQFDAIQHHSSASIGVTLFGDASETIDHPLQRADLAMYQAKLAGHNALRFFDPQMQIMVNARVAMEAGLREALKERQFLLHYQAQIEDGHVIGVEALVRWLEPSKGLISPAAFIPMAEETGLIVPLGRWVLEAACSQLAIWATQPALAHLTIAVNVSARQFRQDDFVAQVLDVLDRTGAQANRLKLELTESVLVTSIEDIITKMNSLKEKGVGFSLDDFGTGYSSLSYLKRLPLDQLKIDQGFVRDILSDTNDAAIAKMVIVLADALGLAVIAEGVETEAQRDFLADMGCNNYQGYLFNRPVPIHEFEELATKSAHA